MSQLAARRALVTGGTGFIGLHLIRRLRADGWEVDAVIRAGSAKEKLEAVVGAEHLRVHDGTIEGMLAIVGAAKPAIVFHVASLFLAQHTSAQVSQLVRSNVEFPAMLAEAMAVHKVGYLVNTGTSWQHFENGDFNPVNLYAATKQAFADVVRYYVGAGAFRAIHLELFDTFGPGDERPKLFRLLRKTAASGESLQMSAGEQMIDLVYIDDVIDAFMLAAARVVEASSAEPETYSVATGSPLRLRDLVATWERTTGRKVKIEWGARPYRPREVMTPWSRGAILPGWRSRVALEEGIRRMEGLS